MLMFIVLGHWRISWMVMIDYKHDKYQKMEVQYIMVIQIQLFLNFDDDDDHVGDYVPNVEAKGLQGTIYLSHNLFKLVTLLFML